MGPAGWKSIYPDNGETKLMEQLNQFKAAVPGPSGEPAVAVKTETKTEKRPHESSSSSDEEAAASVPTTPSTEEKKKKKKKKDKHADDSQTETPKKKKKKDK